MIEEDKDSYIPAENRKAKWLTQAEIIEEMINAVNKFKSRPDFDKSAVFEILRTLIKFKRDAETSKLKTHCFEKNIEKFFKGTSLNQIDKIKFKEIQDEILKLEPDLTFDKYEKLIGDLYSSRKDQ